MLAENPLIFNCQDLKLGDIPRPQYWIGDLIQYTFIYKESDVTVIETARIVGLYFHPIKKDWEYIVYWLESNEPSDVRPMFEETALSFAAGFEDECVKILVSKIAE